MANICKNLIYREDWSKNEPKQLNFVFCITATNQNLAEMLKCSKTLCPANAHVVLHNSHMFLGRKSNSEKKKNQCSAFGMNQKVHGIVCCFLSFFFCSVSVESLSSIG